SVISRTAFFQRLLGRRVSRQILCSAHYNAPVVIKAPPGTISLFLLLLLNCSIAQAQDRRLWVIQAPATVIEYDPQTFVQKGSRPVPAEVPNAPQVLQINHQGQMLFAPSPDDPSPDVAKGALTFWLWDGRS